MPENSVLTHAQLKTPKAAASQGSLFAAPVIDPVATTTPYRQIRSNLAPGLPPTRERSQLR